MADRREIISKGKKALWQIAYENNVTDYVPSWALPDNEELRSCGRDPNMLCEGDVVTVLVPSDKNEAGATESNHPFGVPGQKAVLPLRIVTWGNVPCVKTTFWLRIQDNSGNVIKCWGKDSAGKDLEALEGETDKNGDILTGGKYPEIPLNTDTAMLVLTAPLTLNTAGETVTTRETDPPAIEVTLNLQIGRMRPIKGTIPQDQLIIGVQQRLNNLGFGPLTVNGTWDTATGKAAQRFYNLFQSTSQLEAPWPTVPAPGTTVFSILLSRLRKAYDEGTPPSNWNPPASTPAPKLDGSGDGFVDFAVETTDVAAVIDGAQFRNTLTILWKPIHREIAICEKVFRENLTLKGAGKPVQSNCSGYVRLVAANLGYDGFVDLLANGIVDKMAATPTEWEDLGKGTDACEKARERANAGKFVVAGVHRKKDDGTDSTGHVQVVVAGKPVIRSDKKLCPVVYQGNISENVQPGDKAARYFNLYGCWGDEVKDVRFFALK